MLSGQSAIAAAGQAPASLVEHLRGLAQQRPDDIWLTVAAVQDGRVVERSHSYGEFDRRVRALAARLQQLCPVGARALVMMDNDEHYAASMLACFYAGVIAVPVPPLESLRVQHLERLLGIVGDADAACVISTAEVMQALPGADARFAGIAAVAADQVDLADAEAWRPHAPAADDIAFLQYTSGSTSAPKGVMVSHGNLIANEAAIQQRMDIGAGDRFMSWAPLYHDMGLVGFLLSPCMGQVTVDYLATPAFARRPALWLKLMSDNRCTVAYGPSFGYDLSSRRVNGGAKDLDLSAWRIAGIGGDMVRPDVLEEFASRMAVAGFDPKAFLPSYGMAESTLAITFPELDKPVRVDCVDRLEYKLNRKAVPAGDLAQKRPEQTRSFVVCGKPLPDHKIEVRDDHGKVLNEREIGHILIQGPSLMAGYFGNEHATKNVLSDDGWLDTGDMGYWLDGEIVITGRSKDLILHNGRNIWPQDIEWSAEQVEPLRSGDVAAFAVEDDNDEDHVVVLVQCRLSKRDEREDLRRDVKAAIQRSAGVECYVVLVPPRSLPFTSSGKLSRAGAKAGFLNRDIVEIDDEYVPVGAASAAPVRVGMQAAE